jgi:hypothetical protein
VRTHVARSLTVSSPAAATALLQVAVAAPGSEQLTVLSAGRPVTPEEIAVPGARVPGLELAAGETTIACTAAVEPGGRPREVTRRSGRSSSAPAATARPTSWRASPAPSSTGVARAPSW